MRISTSHTSPDPTAVMLESKKPTMFLCPTRSLYTHKTQTHTQTDRQTDRHALSHTYTHTFSYTDINIHTQTHTHKYHKYKRMHTHSHSNTLTHITNTEPSLAVFGL